MKKVILIAILVLAATVAYSQVDVKKIIKNKTNSRAEKKTGQAVDKSLDKAEEGVKNLFKKDEKTEEKKEPQKSDKVETSSESDTQPSGNKQEINNKEIELKWSRYDFVPGDEIIFEDDLSNEENGEFPSRWDLVAGNVENVTYDNENVIFFFSKGASIIPYLKNRDSDYMPEEFTLEFDAWFQSSKYGYYNIWFADTKNQKAKDLYFPILRIYAERVLNNGTYYGEQSSTKENYWRHIAISFNKRALKVYLDETRILNIPNMEINPTGLRIGIDDYGSRKDQKRFIKNIRLAKGAVKLYDKLQQDGKIVSSGIRFDTGKATIRPESMGVINKIYSLMKKHEDVKFSVEGHTDDTGNEDSNLKLSQKRAEAVVLKLIKMGIAKDRFASKGFGEGVPVASNDTAEGRANNRRVEFVKM